MADKTAYQCTLSPELVEKAERELNEKAQWRERDVQALRDMVVANKALKCPTDDGFLLRFLRARKFDYDRAYKLLIDYYTLRAQNKTYFKDFTPSSVKKVLDAEVTIGLPKPDKEGRKIMYFRPGCWNPDEYSIWEVFKTNVLTMEKFIMDEKVQVNGLIVIGDFTNIGWNQAKNLDRTYAGLFTKLLQEAFPGRFKGFSCIFEPSFFSIVYALVKPFLKAKTASRFTFYGQNLEGLQKDFGLDCLPKELGGTLGALSELAKEWNKELLASEDTYKAMNQNFIDLPRELMAGQTGEDTMECLTGTYKKLGVD